MHKKAIVINTGPLIALMAVFSELSILRKLFSKAIVPYEVSQEILISGNKYTDAVIFKQDSWLDKREITIDIKPFLTNSLDKGEAAVIQTALNEGINTVCIDEAVGRRIARLNSLQLTGSLGIIISAIKNGEKIDIKEAIRNMRNKGVWISKELEKEAIRLAKKG